MQRLFTVCAVTYLAIYTLEGVIRYGLYNLGQDRLILLRDMLIILPLALSFAAQAFRGRVQPAFPIFAAIIALHGTIATINLGSWLPAVYGAKLLVNVLFGFLALRLAWPDKGVLTIFVLLWAITVTGLALDKFVVTFPWIGLEAHIGGIRVDVSRGWDIDDLYDKRVAGFTRSSISAAMLLPVLAMIIAPRIRGFVARATMLVLTIGAVLLTTQKGSIVALTIVSAVLCAPYWSRYSLLCTACIGFALLAVTLPLLTSGLLMSQGGGVFSGASFAMRITQTWPDAWHWISRNDAFPFGVGLGGIGGAQRFYAPNSFNPSDNLFVYLYANFGVMSLVYITWVTALGLRLPWHVRSGALPALAVLAFLLGYGAALSVLEDQVAALFLGAAAGLLWNLRQRPLAENGSEPFRGTDPRRPGSWDLPVYTKMAEQR